MASSFRLTPQSLPRHYPVVEWVREDTGKTYRSRDVNKAIIELFGARCCPGVVHPHHTSPYSYNKRMTVLDGETFAIVGSLLFQET